MSISYLQQAAVGGITTPDNAEEQKTEAEAGYSAGNVSLHTDTRLQVVLHQKMVRREGNVSEAQNQQRHNAQITVRKLMKIQRQMRHMTGQQGVNARRCTQER